MTEMTLKPKLDEPGMNTSATTHKLKEELTRLGCRGAKKRQKEKEKPLSTALSKPPKPENAGLDTDSGKDAWHRARLGGDWLEEGLQTSLGPRDL